MPEAAEEAAGIGAEGEGEGEGLIGGAAMVEVSSFASCSVRPFWRRNSIFLSSGALRTSAVSRKRVALVIRSSRGVLSSLKDLRSEDSEVWMVLRLSGVVVSVFVEVEEDSDLGAVVEGVVGEGVDGVASEGVVDSVEVFSGVDFSSAMVEERNGGGWEMEGVGGYLR